jgi:mannosyltransferase OCH1-like enzyme
LWEAVLQHLEVSRPAAGDDDLPRKIYTTSKEVVPDYAEQFEGWSRLNPDWEIVNYDDEKTLKWLKSMFPAEHGQKEAQLIHEFAFLNRGVLKGVWQMRCEFPPLSLLSLMWTLL